MLIRLITKTTLYKSTYIIIETIWKYKFVNNNVILMSKITD